MGIKMQVTKRSGRREPIDIEKIHKAVEWACHRLNVSQSEIEMGAHIQFFDGIKTEQIQKALINSAASLVDKDKMDYEYAAARLLLQQIYKEVTGGEVSYPPMIEYITIGIAENRLSPHLVGFDFERIDKAIVADRDLQFKHLGLQTIYDRYLIRSEPKGDQLMGDLIELPQHFWMRVAMGLALNEGSDKTHWAIEFYNVLSKFEFVSSTPTLFNSGTLHSQMSSCYVLTTDDSIFEPNPEGSILGKGIFATNTEAALYSKFSGGIGADWTRVRPTGGHISSTNGMSSGIIPYLKMFNDTSVAVNQGGKRSGSFAVYLEPWHGDIERFIDLKKPNGDERLRARELFPALWTNDLFMERVRDRKQWSLFCSHAHPELHELYGEAFKERYEQLEAEEKQIRSVEAFELWKKVITALVESGAPWITFKDEMNRRNPQSHVGVIHSSNLCCMTADQRVVTDAGIMTVEELYKSGRKNKVVGLGEISDASEMVLPRPNAPIVRVETAEGYSHKVTPDHRVWAKDKGWVEAQHLVPGDKLLTQQIEGLWGDDHNPKLALIAGLVAGDGTFLQKENSTSVCIDLWNDKTGKFHNIVENAVAELIAGQDVVTTSSTEPKFSYDEGRDKYRLCSAPLARVLSDKGFTKDTKLFVPEFVWKGTKPTVTGYLRGLYLTDGNVQSGKDTTVMSLASSRREFLQEIQILWANFGVKTSICKLHDGGARDFKDGYGEYECKPVWRLLITSIQGCQIAEKVTLIGKFRTGDVANKFLGNLKKKGYSQKLYATFTHLTELPNEDAYCLKVDSESHAWTVNGLITHNTEISLNTSDSESAVCNLGSVNISVVGPDMFGRVIPTAMRMLDNVIDLNFYPTDKSKNSNMKHRPVGLGIMGWTDYIVSKGISWESEEHLRETDDVFERFSYWAIRGSVELAKERGRYDSYYGSKWDLGILPIDTARKLPEEWSGSRGVVDWEGLRTGMKKWGMRNSNVMAIAPTATIANIVGTEPCIEPVYYQVTIKENKSGKFKIVSPAMRHGRHDLCKPAFLIDQKWLVKAAAIRQKWIDQSQSVNIFKYANAKGNEISEWYFLAWELGLKATYYLRQQVKAMSEYEAGVFFSKGESVNAALSEESALVCSLQNPEACESCQ